jgi:hypothetical protein
MKETNRIRRTHTKQSAVQAPVENPLAAADYWRAQIQNLINPDQPCVAALFLDAGRCVLEQQIIVGTLNVPRFRKIGPVAKRLGSSEVILMRNQPEGDPRFILEEAHAIRSFKRACAICQINLLDNIIVKGQIHFSMREAEGWDKKPSMPLTRFPLSRACGRTDVRRDGSKNVYRLRTVRFGDITFLISELYDDLDGVAIQRSSKRDDAEIRLVTSLTLDQVRDRIRHIMAHIDEDLDPTILETVQTPGNYKAVGR